MPILVALKITIEIQDKWSTTQSKMLWIIFIMSEGLFRCPIVVARIALLAFGFDPRNGESDLINITHNISDLVVDHLF